MITNNHHNRNPNLVSEKEMPAVDVGYNTFMHNRTQLNVAYVCGLLELAGSVVINLTYEPWN